MSSTLPRLYIKNLFEHEQHELDGTNFMNESRMHDFLLFMGVQSCIKRTAHLKAEGHGNKGVVYQAAVPAFTERGSNSSLSLIDTDD